MNEWGLPNWREASSYGDWENWTTARYYWEFIRRSDEYRKEAMALLDVLKARPLTDEEWLPYWGRWAYDTVLDPRISDYPQDRLLMHPHKGVKAMKGSPSDRAGPRNRIEPRSDEITISLNLDKPLLIQMEKVERAFKVAQINRHGKTIIEKPREGEWFKYLRVIDAKADGMRHWEVAEGVEGIASAQLDKDAKKQAVGSIIRQAKKVGQMIALSNTLTG